MKSLDSEYLRPIETSLGNSTGKPPSLLEPNLPDYSPQALRSIPLKTLQQPATIIAIDASNIKLGETETGMLTAIRAAVVWKQNRQDAEFGSAGE